MISRMRRIERIFGLVVISLAILFGLVYIFLTIAGKAIISRQLESLTNKKTTIEYFGFTPGFHLQIVHLDIQGLFKADSIYITPDIFGLLCGKLSFNNLKFIRPELTFIRTPPVIVEGVKPNAEIILAEPLKPVEPQTPNSLPIGFKHFKIKDGTLIFIDQIMTSKSIKIVIKDLNCSLNNFYLYHRPVVTKFTINGNIPWRDGEEQGKVKLDGWINYAKKDMRATLSIKDIDAIYLYPYYSTWVDLDKARIEKARLNFASEIIGINNDVSANCHMELVDMVRKPLEVGESEEKASLITNKVLDMFKAVDQGRVELNFSVKTKMNNPQFGFDNFKTAFEGKLMQSKRASAFKPEDAFSLPVKAMQSGFKSFTDLGRAMVDGVFAIGKEIGKLGGENRDSEPVSSNS